MEELLKITCPLCKKEITGDTSNELKELWKEHLLTDEWRKVRVVILEYWYFPQRWYFLIRSMKDMFKGEYFFRRLYEGEFEFDKIYMDHELFESSNDDDDECFKPIVYGIVRSLDDSERMKRELRLHLTKELEKCLRLLREAK